MTGSISPYAVITGFVVFIIALAVVGLCWHAMRSGSIFKGEIGNRLLSMKIHTEPAPPSPGNTTDSGIPAAARPTSTLAPGGLGQAPGSATPGNLSGEPRSPGSTPCNGKPRD